MITPEKALKKLRKPPAVHNWVRNIHRRRDDTARSLFEMAINGPRHSLRSVNDIIRSVVVDGIEDEQAFKCAARIANSRVRGYAQEILTAILPYIRHQKLTGVEVFKDIVEYFRAAANVNVPIRPTFVINDGERVIPYFVICWARIGLTDYQKRLLSTLITESILSLEEFEGSDAVILCVPRHDFSKTERYVIEWRTSMHRLLTGNEKVELFERYNGALLDAEEMIINNLG